MNLKASKLNRWALIEGAERYFMVKSFGHLSEKIKISNSHCRRASFLIYIKGDQNRSNMSNTRKSVSPGLQTPRSGLKKRDAAKVFEYLMKQFFQGLI